MKTYHREMVNTRRLYALENRLYKDHRFTEITKSRSITYLQRLATTIWKNEGITKSMPVIRFGKGTYHIGEYYSWCDGTTIELAPTQRDVLTLIHELVHAMGMGYHNKKFVHTEVYLLHMYTSTNTGVLLDTFEDIL